MKKKSGVTTLLWLFFGAFALLRCLTGVSQGGVLASLGPLFFVGLLLGFALLHGIVLYGLKDFLAFLAIAFVVSWLYENCSIITGFPFGHYRYTDALGPKLWHVPVFIMLAYAAVGYLAWTLSQVLLDNYQNLLRGKNTFFVPLLASFVMVQWDVCMDPVKATIAKQWIWAHGGAYFGIPLSNYAGWFLCVYTIFQLFALYLRRKAQPAQLSPPRKRSFWMLPGLMYGAIFLEFPFLALSRPNRLISSLDKQQWWTGDIYWSMTLVWVFTMVLVALLSTLKTLNHSFDEKAGHD